MADNVIVCIPGIPPLTWGGSQEARPKCEDDKPIGLWASQGRINKFSFPKEPSQWKERKIAIETIMNTTKFSIPMNQEQVNNLLKNIDTTLDETAKIKIFTQLGHDCFYSRHQDQWVDQFKGDVQKFLDNINIQHQSKFWESLIFSADKSRLILTGKEVDGCACSYAACNAPPLALCNHCCKSFQRELFTYLLGNPVEVTITESFLLGNKRCSTIIDIV